MSCPVLIVDDDADLRSTIQRALEDEGYDTLLASNGREALDTLGRPHLRPCLILLDLMMPIVSGWEVLERLEADPDLSCIPVAIMSACRTPQRPRNLGQRDELDFLFLRKPLKLEALLAIVAEKCPQVQAREGEQSLGHRQ